MKKENNSTVTSKNLSTSEPPSNQNLKVRTEQPKIIYDYSIPKRKTPRIIFDYSGTTSRTDQHTISTNDINVLIKKYRPDEMAAYLMARGRQQQPIQGHDFSIEPNYQDALNEVVRIKQIYNDLPQEIQAQFKSPMDFVKFVDNPKNIDRLVDLKLLTKKEASDLKPEKTTTTQTTTTKTDPDPASKKPSDKTE